MVVKSEMYSGVTGVVSLEVGQPRNVVYFSRLGTSQTVCDTKAFRTTSSTDTGVVWHFVGLMEANRGMSISDHLDGRSYYVVKSAFA